MKRSAPEFAIVTCGIDARELLTVSEYVIAVAKRERMELFAVAGTLRIEIVWGLSSVQS